MVNSIVSKVDADHIHGHQKRRPRRPLLTTNKPTTASYPSVVGLTVIDIPAGLRSHIYETPHFRGLCVSSWRYAAYTMHDAIRREYREFKASSDQGERAYLGWFIITSVVEMTEMVATAILNAREPGRFAVHQADNSQIESLFTDVRDHGIGAEEIRSILGIRGPRGLNVTAIRALRVLESVIEQIQTVLQALAVFWLEHIEHTKWFRHYPATLSPEEAWLIDREASEESRAKAAELMAMPGAIEIVTLMKEANFEHILLREQLVLEAVLFSDAATGFLLMSLFNAGLDPRRAGKTTLFPQFLRHLNDDERAFLFVAGNYVDPD